MIISSSPPGDILTGFKGSQYVEPLFSKHSDSMTPSTLQLEAGSGEDEIHAGWRKMGTKL
jgi:hypothetical protein